MRQQRVTDLRKSLDKLDLYRQCLLGPQYQYGLVNGTQIPDILQSVTSITAQWYSSGHVFPSTEGKGHEEVRACGRSGLGTFLIPQAAFAGHCSDCAVEHPDAPILPQTPEENCSSRAVPTPAPQRLADNCSTCAIQQDDEPIITQEPRDCGTCALPKLRPQRASVPAKPIIVADSSGNGGGT